MKLPVCQIPAHNAKSLNVIRGTWVAQSVKHRPHAFGSGHDLTVGGIDLHISLCTDSMEPTWDSLSLSLCPSPVPSFCLSILISK